MSLLERDSRSSRCGGSLWRMDLTGRDLDDRRNRHPRQLVLEPYTVESPTTYLACWVEETRPAYVYVVDDLRQRPKGPPTFQTQTVELNKSRHMAVVTDLGWTIVRALARNELIGESAKDGIYGLFWNYFVMNDDGLTYFCRYASKETGNHWACERFRLLVTTDDEQRILDPVAHMIYEATHEREALLGVRAWQRAQADRTFYDAVDAVARTGGPEDQRAKATLQLLQAQSWRKSKNRG
jgi:hypothetical protein